MNKLTVDFVIQETAEKPAPSQEILLEPAAIVVRGGKCSCGGERFVLASEMQAGELNRLPASRMYECLACGEYRLA